MARRRGWRGLRQQIGKHAARSITIRAAVLKQSREREGGWRISLSDRRNLENHNFTANHLVAMMCLGERSENRKSLINQMDPRRGGWGSLSSGDLVGDIIGVFSRLKKSYS